MLYLESIFNKLDVIDDLIAPTISRSAISEIKGDISDIRLLILENQFKNYPYKYIINCIHSNVFEIIGDYHLPDGDHPTILIEKFNDQWFMHDNNSISNYLENKLSIDEIDRRIFSLQEKHKNIYKIKRFGTFSFDITKYDWGESLFKYEELIQELIT